MNHSTHNQPTVEICSLTQLLTQFRKKLEAEAAEPVTGLEVNAALLLSDLCRFLGLGASRRQQVLGEEATRFTNDIEGVEIKLPVRH